MTIVVDLGRKATKQIKTAFSYHATVSVLFLFPMMPRVGLQCVIVVFSGHTFLFFTYDYKDSTTDQFPELTIDLYLGICC